MKFAIAAPLQNKANFRAMPGFNLSLGFAVFYLGLIVLIPLSAVFLKTFSMSCADFWSAISSDRVVASYRLSFGASMIGAALNVVFGGIVAWVLVRYSFPGKKIIDALVDLPFALPYKYGGATFERFPLAEVLVQLGFADREGDYGSEVVISRHLLPFIEAYFDKSNSEINQTLRRRLHWLAD